MSCSGGCRNVVTAEQVAEIECVACGGAGCDHCTQGYFVLSECPQEYIGAEIIGDINIVAACENGVLPVAGGLLDQSQYYLELSNAMKSEMALIEKEQREKKNG